MNIFFLDWNPTLCAQYHTDKHVVKMIVETAQLLSTAHHVSNSEVAPFVYRKTHTNHPSAVWVRQNSTNYTWTFALLKALLQEYTYRYGKEHSTAKLVHYLSFLPKDMPITRLVSRPPQAMPDEYKADDCITAYRNYYKNGKSHLHTWTKREKPKWLEENL